MLMCSVVLVIVMKSFEFEFQLPLTLILWVDPITANMQLVVIMSMLAHLVGGGGGGGGGGQPCPGTIPPTLFRHTARMSHITGTGELECGCMQTYIDGRLVPGCLVGCS